jgi:hypothetical protein
VPKGPDRAALLVSADELRELHLALALRITRLTKIDPGKLTPSERAKVRRHLELCTELHDAVQKQRRK